MRKALVALVTLAMVFGGSSLAQADITGVLVDYADRNVGEPPPRTDRIFVYGFVQCDPGERFSVRVSLWSESGAKATGRTSGICDGVDGPTAQNGGTEWVVKARMVSGEFDDWEVVLWRARAQNRTSQKTASGFVAIVPFCICP